MQRRYKLRAALLLLAGFHAAIIFAGFFAPYDFAAQDRELPFAPPTPIHFVDQHGNLHARPFIYGLCADPASPSLYTTDPTREYPLYFLVPGAPYRIAGLFAVRTHFFGVHEPGRILLLGADAYGRDQLSRFLYGGQISLLAGLLAAALSVSLGVVVGALSGFYGGWIDEALMRGGDLFLALPWLYLLFAVRAALPLHVSQRQVFLMLDRRDGTDRMGAPGAADSRSSPERQGTQLRAGGARIRCLGRLSSPPPRSSPGLRRGAHADYSPHPAVHPG